MSKLVFAMALLCSVANASYFENNRSRDVSNPSHTPEPSAWTQESRVGDTLYIDGEVQEIQWSALRSGEYKGVKRVVLNSRGGLVMGAVLLAKEIRAQGLTTVIPAGGVCMSACTLLFQAGVKRQAHSSAIFMYHAPRSGRIGIANLLRKCKEKGPRYCRERQQEFVDRADQVTNDFFEVYYEYDLNSEFMNWMYTLPEEPESQWREDGNWFKKADLVFSNDAEDSRLSRLEGFVTMPTSYLQELNVVTDWFTDDPGWAVDKNVEPENPYSMP